MRKSRVSFITQKGKGGIRMKNLDRSVLWTTSTIILSIECVFLRSFYVNILFTTKIKNLEILSTEFEMSNFISYDILLWQARKLNYLFLFLKKLKNWTMVCILFIISLRFILWTISWVWAIMIPKNITISYNFETK